MIARALALLGAGLAPSVGAPVAPGAPGPAGENRMAFARIELCGPLDGARLEIPLGGECVVRGVLLTGERREQSVPYPAAPPGQLAQAGEPTIVPLSGDQAAAVGASARILGLGYEVEALELMWSELPAALRARSLPGPAALGASSNRAPSLPGRAAPRWASGGGAALAILALAWITATALAARPRLLVAVQVACAALLFAGPFVARRVAGTLQVFEGDEASGVWMQHSASQGELALETNAVLRLVAEPVDARLSFVVTLDEPTRFTCAPSMGAPRGTVVRAFARLAARPELSFQRNGWRELAASWTRAGSGAGNWIARGRWPVGAGLPPHNPPQDPPGSLADTRARAVLPGWAVVGLPQGAPVVVALLADAPAAWVRWVGAP